MNSEIEMIIRSRHGMVRDIVPIYSFRQLLLNLLVLGLTVWVIDWHANWLPTFLIIVLLLWVFQFPSRPSLMVVSVEQAKWLEEVLGCDGAFAKSDEDCRWRDVSNRWWNHFPHEYIEFLDASPKAVIAPRKVLESLREALESSLAAENVQDRESTPSIANEDSEYEPSFPWSVKAPAVVLGVICVAALFWSVVNDDLAGVDNWGLSASALAQGRFEVLLLHMFAHGGFYHLFMNMAGLAAIGPTLTSRLGSMPMSWLRFAGVFLVSGLVGALFYLLLHPTGSVPMVGASGGIYGLFGLLLRIPADGGPLVDLRSVTIRRAWWDFVKQNAFLFTLLALLQWAGDMAIGLAWEAHLGGFLCGLLIGPSIVPTYGASKSEREPRSIASSTQD